MDSSGSDGSENEPDSRSAGAAGGIEADTCAACGEPIETYEWHPIDVVVDDEAVCLYTFCSRACHATWEPD